MKKQYGIGYVLGMENKTLLFEYQDATNNKCHYYIFGEDIVTGTKIESMVSENYTEDLSVAASKGILKKNCIIIQKWDKIDKGAMCDYLGSMSREDVEKYVKKVKGIKALYKETIAANRRKKVLGYDDILKKEKIRVRMLALGIK